MKMSRPHAANAEEADLWAALKTPGRQRAREDLFTRYAPFAFKIAKNCHTTASGGVVELGDLRHWACAGLLEAIDGFDPGRGTPFAPYARRRIRGSVLDGLARASERQEQLSAKTRRRKERLDSLADDVSAGRNADDALGRLLDLAVGQAIGFMLDDTNLYVDGDTPERAPGAYESLAWRETLALLERAVLDLPAPEAAVIRHHYGGELSFTEIASLMGRSKGRISQLHRSALSGLRRRIKRPLKPPYAC